MTKVAQQKQNYNFDNSDLRAGSKEDFQMRARDAWQLVAEIRARWLLTGGRQDSWRQAIIIRMRAFVGENATYALPNELHTEMEYFLR
eukprot:600179-Alexandrium_andersonii.AAC.1